MSLEAVQHVRRMRGGAQSHLMRCSDGHFYVVKFRNNPQHLRVLANEILASRLARFAGIPVPDGEVVEVNDWLIDPTPELCIQLAHQNIRCQAGPQFGSRYVVNPMEGQVFDYLPTEMLGRVRNLETFAGALVLDKWTGNTDGRQVAFWTWKGNTQPRSSTTDTASMAENGHSRIVHCAVYARNEVYEGISGWNSFEPWLSNVEQIPDAKVWQLAEAIPPEWYCDQWHELEVLVGMLLSRRTLVKGLIENFRRSPRRPFPGWAET